MGRSFNFVDIEEKLISKLTYTNYQTHLKNYYPIIHMYEEYSNVDGNEIPKGGEAAVGVKALTRSEQNKYYTATENGAIRGYKKSTISIVPTILQVPTLTTGSFTNSNHYYITLKSGNSNINLTQYWLASRCVNISIDIMYFGVHIVNSGYLTLNDLFRANIASQYGFDYAVRPVVEIPLSYVEIGNTGAGEASDPFSLDIK